MDTNESASRPRVGFDELRSHRSPGNKSVVTVDLTGPSGEPYAGSCEGEDSPTAQLSSAATAALRALEAAAHHRIRLTLEGITEFTEFNIVLVQIAVAKAEGDDILRLGGAGFVNGKPLHAAVMATLQATNRVFETDFRFLH